MADTNKKRKVNPLMAFAEEYNISRVDVIIYSACILVLAIAIGVFALFSKDMVKKQMAYKEITNDLIESGELKQKQLEIKKDYENINSMTLDLRNRFLSDKQINDFKEAVKKLAKEYKCERIDATERAEARDQDTFYTVRINGMDTKKKLTLKKKSIEFTFQMTLGNFVGFLKSLESCNKIIEVPPFRISRGDDDNTVKLTSFVVYAYVVPNQLDFDLKTVLNNVTFEEHITPVNIKEKAQVVQIREKKIAVKEVVRTNAGQWDISPIFRPIKPPPPKPIVPPKDLRYFMASGGGKYAFVLGGDTSKVYIAGAGDIVETKAKEKIPGYENLVLKSFDKSSFIFEMEEVSGELSKFAK